MKSLQQPVFYPSLIFVMCGWTKITQTGTLWLQCSWSIACKGMENHCITGNNYLKIRPVIPLPPRPPPPPQLQVDKHIRHLDSELSRFEHELQLKDPHHRRTSTGSVVDLQMQHSMLLIYSVGPLTARSYIYKCISQPA